MKATILASGLALALMPAAPAVAKPGPVVRFATYNVCKTSCGTGQWAWPKRRDAIVRTILSAKPDVLALQEADNSYSWLEDRLRASGYRRVLPAVSTYSGDINDSQLFFRSQVIRQVQLPVPSPPIAAACLPFFPVTPGVPALDPPDEPQYPPYPQYPDLSGDDYEQKLADYDAAVKARDALVAQLEAQYLQQLKAYRQRQRDYSNLGCYKYQGWQPFTPAGSGEVSLAQWGAARWKKSSDDRNLMWAVLQHKASGTPLLAASIHLPNEKSPAAEKYRKSLAAAIPVQLRASTRELGLNPPTVLMGDFNSFRARQPRGAQWLLGRSGFRDAFAAPKKVNADISTANVTPDRNSWPARPRRLDEPARIDYVMFNRGRALRYEVHLHLRNGAFDNRYRGSDHNLVLADIRLPAGGLGGQWQPVG